MAKPISNDKEARHSGETRAEQRNEDPITGEAGSHPVGTGAGAALGGAAAGAAAGLAAGPIGTAVGAVVGGVAGGLIGKSVAEQIDPTVEEAYWRDEYRNRDYVAEGDDFEVYAPAYQYGWESRRTYHDRQWEDVEADLERDWANHPSSSTLAWDQARPATRDAWDRIGQDSGDLPPERTAPRPK